MMASFDMLRSQQDAARALFELAGRSTTLPAAPAPLPGMGAPLFLLPSLHQSQSGGAFFPNLFVPGGLCLPTLPAFTSTPSSGAPTPSSATGNNQRLSVAYLLNNDDSLTTGRPATIKQEPATAAPVLHKRKTSSSTSTSSSATRGSKRPKVEPSFSSSPASSSPPSSPPSHSSSLSSTSSIASSSTSTPFKGDLSLFPHLQLQLQREQLDPQQHTELVLKVWNRQQQVLKLQQLQQKKQELKAQRLRQRQSRKGSKGAVASPLSPGSSSSLPSSPASADVAAQSALPTIDDILNGADVQVDESSGGSDEDSNGNKKGSGKRPRRRITARQVAVLEQVFAVEPFPGPSTKKVIAKKLGMQERSITIWFQNKRARLKRIDGDSATGHHHGQVGENGKREVTFHNLAVGFDGKLDMLPEDF